MRGVVTAPLPTSHPLTRRMATRHPCRLPANVFFKFARDTFGVYGGDAAAAKSANHELRSLRALVGCDEPSLAFPLMVTVDYAGHRLCAVSVLPISDATLVYGSADQGRTICSSDVNMNRGIKVRACRCHA